METNNLNKIYQKLQELGINDAINSEQMIIIPVDKEENFPGYKLAVTNPQEESYQIFASFYHNAVLKEEKVRLLKLLNKFNLESVLKFSLYQDFIKVSIDLSEVLDSELLLVIRNITIFPTILSQFEQDLVKVIK